MEIGNLVKHLQICEIGIITDVMRANIMSMSWVLVYWPHLQHCTVEKPSILVVIDE